MDEIFVPLDPGDGGTAIGAAAPAGSIVELDPSQGRVMKGYSADVSPSNFMVVLEKAWRVAEDYATDVNQTAAVGGDTTAEIPTV